MSTKLYRRSIKKSAWETIKSLTVFKGRLIRIKHDIVGLPGGGRGIYDYLEKNDSVIIIAKINQTFVLVEQYRYTIRQPLIEFPQGGTRSGESPEIAAKRELAEETGFVAQSMVLLGKIYLQKGITSQGGYVYVASGLSKGKQNLEAEEQELTVKTISQSKLKKMIKERIITDAPTLAAYALYSSR